MIYIPWRLERKRKTKMENINNPSQTPANSPYTFGFIGVGVINAAIIRGLCTPSNHNRNGDAQDSCNENARAAVGLASGLVQFPLLLSPRNEEKGAELLKEFGEDLIKVCTSNAEVAEKSGVIVVGLTPAVTREVGSNYWVV